MEPTATPQPPRNTLFVGDSSIYYNGGHAFHLEKLTATASPPLDIEAWDITRSAASLEPLWNAEGALACGTEAARSAKASEEISNGTYDAVVLYIGIHYYVVDTQREYASKFISVCRDAGARPLLYMGWPFDPRVYPSSEVEGVTPFDHVAQGVRDMSTELGVGVVPVALAWQRAMEACPAVELYQPDADHPTLHGTYLSVNVVYATLFGRSPVGLSYRPAGPTGVAGVTEEEADCLQRVAWETVEEYRAQR